MQKEVYNQLHQDEPPPRDIFTVFRENHPETLFELDRPANYSPPDFSRRTEVDLRSGEGVTEPNSILKYIKDRAVISDANKAVADTIDVNACLKDHNWEGAEHILGRKLTQEEKQAQMVKEQQAPLIDQAQRQLKLEELKGRIKEGKKKRKALLAKWKAIGDKARKEAEAAAVAAEIARVNKLLADDLADLLRMSGFYDDDDDDDDAGLGGLGGGDDDDDEDDEDDEGGDEAGSVSTVVYRGKKGKDGEEKEELESIASTVLDKDKKRGQAIVNTIEVPPLDPDLNYTMSDLLQRGHQLRQRHSELGTRVTGILSNLKGTKDEIRAKIEKAEKWIDKKRNEEADKARVKRAMEQADDILASPHEAAGEPLPAPQGGLGVFTGLLKKKNEHDYIKWNDRFVINMKRLNVRVFWLQWPPEGSPAWLPAMPVYAQR